MNERKYARITSTRINQRRSTVLQKSNAFAENKNIYLINKYTRGRQHRSVYLNIICNLFVSCKRRRVVRRRSPIDEPSSRKATVARWVHLWAQRTTKNRVLYWQSRGGLHCQCVWLSGSRFDCVAFAVTPRCLVLIESIFGTREKRARGNSQTTRSHRRERRRNATTNKKHTQLAVEWFLFTPFFLVSDWITCVVGIQFDLVRDTFYVNARLENIRWKNVQMWFTHIESWTRQPSAPPLSSHSLSLHICHWKKFQSKRIESVALMTMTITRHRRSDTAFIRLKWER